MTIRDDLERVGAEALLRDWMERAGYDDADNDDALDCTAGVKAVLDALLAYRDPDGERVVILASELERVGFYHTEYGFEGVKHGLAGTENSGVPVFVLRSPSGEPT